MTKYIAYLAVLLLTASCTSRQLVTADGHIYPDKFQYDPVGPDIKVPVLKQPSKDYNPMDYNTFAIYTGVHTVKEPKSRSPKDSYAMWCTKKGTYLVKAVKTHWNEFYSNHTSSMTIRDSRTHKEYALRKVWGLPLDETYWIHAVAGESLCRVYEFPPLPRSCSVIDIIYDRPTKLEVIPGTTGWSGGENQYFLDVVQLQGNQHLMDYVETIIVK